MDDTGCWQQINIEFADWSAAEPTTVARIAPLLRQAENRALISSWFFLRKAPAGGSGTFPPPMPPPLNSMCRPDCEHLPTPGRSPDSDGRSTSRKPARSAATPPWTPPTTFSTTTAGTCSPTSADTRQGIGENWRSCCAAPCYAAPTWTGTSKATCGRASPNTARQTARPPPARIDALAPALRRLMSVDTAPLLADGPLAHTAAWTSTFTALGHQLAHLAANGELYRGIRAVLAHHIVFTWNRHGLRYPDQALLAHTAQRVVFGPDPSSVQYTQATVQ